MSKSLHGTIDVDINGTQYVLRPTLDAYRKIQVRFGGLRGALESLTQLNIEHISHIIAAGAGKGRREIPDIENVPGILETHAAYRAALEERPDTRYQAKAPRRGYMELLEDAMELHRLVPPPTSEEEAEECLDPSTLTEDTTETTETTDTADTPDTPDQN
jgi:hypothetical protein